MINIGLKTDFVFKSFLIFFLLNCFFTLGCTKRVLNLKARSSVKEFDSFIENEVSKVIPMRGKESRKLNSNTRENDSKYKDDTLPPFPFTKTLCLGDSGNNVLIAQMLLSRSPYVNLDQLTINSNYDKTTQDAVTAFQSGNKLTGVQVGCIDEITASGLLKLHSLDNYVNDKAPAKAYNYLYGNYTYKYKIDIQVYSNRSIESTAILYDDKNNNLYEFPVRLHGYRDDDVKYDWPDWSYDYGLNQFTTNGATPTGLFEVDLNSPEPDPNEYGPYPVNRLVRGIDDKLKPNNKDQSFFNNNAAYLVPTARSGLLLHTGEWYKYNMNTNGEKWTPADPMPNSAGCIHSHPKNIENIYKILTTKLNVEVHENPYSEGDKYPYNPQGLLSITHLDGEL